MPTPPASDRAKAMIIRKKVRAKQPVSPEDAIWLADYEANQKQKDQYGRSASKSRKVSYTEEETAAAAEGTGSAAEAAALAAVTREEGRRLDSIIDRGINALQRACDAWEKMTAALLKERQADAVTHRALLESLRSHFLARAEAEADLIKAEAAHHAEKDDGSNPLESAAVQALVERLAAHVATNVNSGNGKGG